MTCAFCRASLDDARPAPGRLVCTRCGVGNTVPWPTDAELELAYAGAYRPQAGRFSGPGDKVLAWSRGRLAGRIDALAPPGAVLDVGAGDGTLVRALRAAGRDAEGLDTHASGDGVRQGAITDETGPFAAVVFWHSLEHLREPGAALDAAARTLSPAGVLVVAVPNAASLQAKLFGARWLALDPPRHLTHLAPGPLAARLRASGLEVERVSHWRGGQVVFSMLDGLVGCLPGHPSLYDAVRRPEARFAALPGWRRLAVLAAGAALLPIALVASAFEIAVRRGGTIHVEARRA